MDRKFCAWILAFSVAGCASGGVNNSLPAGGNGAAQNSNTGALSKGASNFSAAYRVTNLGTFGGSASSAASMNERDWVTGSANLSGDLVAHAFLWRDGRLMNLGTLGGPNSAIAWPNHNNSGSLAGISETSAIDAFGEPWSCNAFFPSAPTKHVCVGFRWRNGVMTALPTLGGPNGYAAGTNDSGTIAGWAENSTHDSTCNSTSGQVLQFKPAFWDEAGAIHELPTLQGDPDGAATAVNNLGQIVGISGICDQAVGRFTAAHVVIWQDGKATQIPTFGGVSWNTPTAVNNHGEVVGFDNVPGADDNAGQLHPLAFLWTKGGGLKKIEPLGGDVYSLAEGINDRGDVVGVSYAAGFAAAHAFIYHNGRTIDLNALVSQGSSLELIAANDINNRGDIVGQASVRGTSETPAFLAIRNGDDEEAALAAASSNAPALAFPQNIRQKLRRQFAGGGIP